MAKAKRKYGMITFYIRPEYREDFEKFEKLIEKDTRLVALRKKDKDGLISIALTQLILKYIDEYEANNPDAIELEDTNETSN